MLNITAYEERRRRIIDDIIRDYVEKTQKARAGDIQVREGSAIRIVLRSPD